MKVKPGDDSLLVDISDALSERDRVRFTVHTRTKLPQFAKPVMSVVRQHEEFIWVHDCLEDNDQYAGYIIPPPPPKPDFDSSREKLQRLGDGEANMTKEEFAKMKQELEAEYLAIFKKTVAMHEIFLQRLAAHDKFREDNNFKIFLEYENELAVRCKSKKEKIAGSISNIGKSLTDFVITTSQVAATTAVSSSILAGHSPSKNQARQQQLTTNGNISTSDIPANSTETVNIPSSTDSSGNLAQSSSAQRNNASISRGDGNNNDNHELSSESVPSTIPDSSNSNTENDDVDEQYFEKERLYLALYHGSIKETAIQADKVTQMQKLVADSYLYIAQQLVRLASIEVVPITAQTKDTSLASIHLPSLTMPASMLATYPSSSKSPVSSSGDSALEPRLSSTNDDLDDDDDDLMGIEPSSSTSAGLSKNDKQRCDKYTFKNGRNTMKVSSGGCADDHTSEGLKQLLLHVSDYLEQARKIETRIASDEDLKLTDTFLYYKRDTNAAQDLLMRRLRFKAEYDTATKNLEKARQKGRTQMQYADVIQKQAKENFIAISRQAKKEIIDYKQRRVASMKKAFTELVELELKHLRTHSNIIQNCLNTCRGLEPILPVNPSQPDKNVSTSLVSSPSLTQSGDARRVSPAEPSTSSMGAAVGKSIPTTNESVVELDNNQSSPLLMEPSTAKIDAISSELSSNQAN